MSGRVRKMLRVWGGKVVSSVGDQGLISGTTFAFNILLIRWLSAEQYGAYAIAFSVFLFISGFHNALILEPMSVLGATRYGDHLPEYLRSLVVIHIGLVMGLGLVLALTAWIFSTGPLRPSLLGVVLAMPFILLFWLFRRFCYLKTEPSLALRGSCVYSSLLFLGIVAMHRLRLITPLSAFILMGTASAGASLTYWISQGRSFSLARTDLDLSAVWPEHWMYGKWAAGSALVYWLSNSIYLPLVGTFAGLAAAGVFQAMRNLVLPLQQSLAALALLLLPWVSKQRKAHGEAYLKQVGPRIVLVSASLSIVYALALVLFGEPLIELIYSQSLYSSFSWILVCFGLISVLAAVYQGLAIVLKALERPDAMFWAQTGGTVLTLTLGLYLVRSSKLLGAIVGSLLTNALMLVILMCFVRSVWKWA